MTKAIKKICAWSLAFVCAVTAGIAAIATNGFGFGDPTAQVEQADHNKQLSFGGFFGNGITLTASAEEATDPLSTSIDTVRLTATVTPSTAVKKGVNWSIAWKNASSTWASGKNVTEYVTVTPTSDGALTADVECKQAFGEQIIVTAILLDNANFSAQCALDYSKRIQALSGDVMSSGMISVTGVIKVPHSETYELNGSVAQQYVCYPESLFSVYENNFNGSYTWGVGTIEESATESYTLEMSDGLRAALKAQGVNTTFTSMEIEADTKLLCSQEFYETILGVSLDEASSSLFKNAINNNAEDYDFVICYNVSTSRSSETARCKVKLSLVEEFSLDQSRVEF